MLLLLGGVFTALTFVILLASGSTRLEALSLKLQQQQQHLLQFLSELCIKLGLKRSNSSRPSNVSPAGSSGRQRRRAQADVEIEIDVVSAPSEAGFVTPSASAGVPGSGLHIGGRAHVSEAHPKTKHVKRSLHGDVPQNGAAGASQLKSGEGAWFPPGASASAATRTTAAAGRLQPTVGVSLLSEQQQQQQQQDGQEPMVLSWENLSCRVTQSPGGGGYRYILQSVSGLAGPHTGTSSDQAASSPSDTVMLSAPSQSFPTAGPAMDGHSATPSVQQGKQHSGGGGVCGAGARGGGGCIRFGQWTRTQRELFVCDPGAVRGGQDHVAGHPRWEEGGRWGDGGGPHQRAPHGRAGAAEGG